MIADAEPLFYTGKRKKPQRRVVVRCDCGTEKAVRTSNLVSGLTTSCGCRQKESASTHGMTRTGTYEAWHSMRQRCSNPNSPNFKHYGGRGITVCDRWQRFESFLADMGEQAGVLDRIDNDKGYAPGNCRWTTWSVSNKNQRQNLKPKNKGV